MKINIIGNLLENDGYSHHTRNLVNALYPLADCKMTTQLPQDWERQVTDAELDMITNPERKDDWNIIITIPYMWKLFLGLGKNACYVVWEGDRCPASWAYDFQNEKVNLILTPSSHTKNAMLKTINESNLSQEEKDNIINKIVIIPHGCSKKIFYNLNKPKQDDIFYFVVNKGWRGTSWDRGGVQYLLQAFSSEFNKDEKVKLIVKLNPAYINPDIIKQSVDALQLPEDRAPIHIISDILSPQKLNDLYNQADCFICATRCEAFGLPGLEAMSTGLANIQTSFGGQLDYMNDKNSLFIDYELSESEEKPLYQNINWATPKIESIRKQMRWAFEHQEDIKQMGKQAEEDSKNFTWDISAQKIIDVLK